MKNNRLRKTKTIDIYILDANYLDAARITNLGKVSYADVIKELCEVHRLALKVGLIESDIIQIVEKHYVPPVEVTS